MVEVITSALELGVDLLIMDDVRARAAAEMSGLSPRGTLWLLVKAVKEKLLSFDGFLATLEAITRHGFYLREELYLKAIKEARKFSGS